MNFGLARASRKYSTRVVRVLQLFVISSRFEEYSNDIRKIGKGSDKSWYKKNLPINQTRNVFHNKSILQLRSTRYVISRGFSRVVKSVPPTDFHRTTRNLVLHRANDYREEKNPRERKEKRRKGEEEKKKKKHPVKHPFPLSILATYSLSRNRLYW